MKKRTKARIHIKAKNKGKLHRALGEKQGKKLSLAEEEELKEHGTPAEKKEANFAINARQWSHK